MLKKLMFYNLTTTNWHLKRVLNKEDRNVLDVISCCGITSERDVHVQAKYKEHDWRINLQYWKGRSKLLC